MHVSKLSPYQQFLASKFTDQDPEGLGDVELSGHLYPHQKDLVAWALRRGRAAIFADTGLGKTAIQIEWAKHVSKKGRVLILAPLSVGPQTAREATRFGVDARYVREDLFSDIVVANYEMMHKFNARDFVGIVLDESSILKSFSGKMRTQIIEAFAATPYKLACTATPSPNDYTELGNHSEFLGIKSRTEMLAEYFVHDGETTSEWRLKGHAKRAFWRWVSSWGAVVRLPSDLGYDDTGYILPPLEMIEHVVPADHTSAWQSGTLFSLPALSLSEQRTARRTTLSKRVELAAEIVANNEPAIVWCELNDESKALGDAIDGAIEVCGQDSAETKEASIDGFSKGLYRVMVTKPGIASHGLNWQHCANMVFVGASHSFEQTYQAIRRCWRYGQKRPVKVHIIRSETESAVSENYKRKERDALAMSNELTSLVANSIKSKKQANKEWNDYLPKVKMEVPEWAITSEI